MKLAKYLLLTIAILTIPAAAYSQTPKDAPFVAPVGSGGVQKVEITGGGYWFKPNHIVVKVDMPVELTVSKESGVIPHDIAMNSPEAGMDFAEGLSSTPKVIKFTPTKPGTYPFYCSKKSPFGKSHKERGMEGVIEVVQ
jgi:plastocyanin